MANVSFQELSSGEWAGVHCIEINKIPHVTLFGKETVDAEIQLQQQQAVMAILGELFNQYKDFMRLAPQAESLLSLEMLWLSEKVTGQVNEARIRPFLITRSVGQNRDALEKQITEYSQIVLSVLTDRKYDAKALPVENVQEILRSAKKDSIQVICKEERILSLQNQMLPSCYSYDLISETGEIGTIVDAMVRYPGCGLSFQLMPTAYAAHEENRLKQISQALDTLAHGIMDHQIGNISFSGAQRPAEIYKEYANANGRGLYAFNLVVFGSREGERAISSRVIAYMNASAENKVAMRTVDLTASEYDVEQQFFAHPWFIHEQIVRRERLPIFWNPNDTMYGCHRLAFILTENEASTLFALPMGSNRISVGFDIIESQMDSRRYAKGIIDAGDIEVGKLRSTGLRHGIGISLKDLTKHMLVVGTPGSGKTTFSVSLLDRLWKQHHIPFLVIEPAKTEYRALVKSIPELQVFTPGKNFISPFVFNPFVPPKNVRLETYKSTLKTAFAAAVSMSTPLDKIFEEAINNCYSDFRWLDSYTVDDMGKIFSIHDFIKCFQETFDGIGYTGDARNIGRAGVVRLTSLSNLFDNYHSIPIEDILSKPTVIELAAIENSDQKALIISLLLLSILAYVNSNYVGEGSLKNLILLEEAHVLLDADSNAGQGEANPSAIAQGLVKRMLAECRSYGVSLVIADQSPRKVTTDVVALTDIKVAFRLVEAMDRQILSDSISMSDLQTQRLSRLKPGEAYFFFNKLDEPEEVVTPDYRLENNISISLSDSSIHELSTYWKDRADLLRPYPQCAKIRYCQASCDYSRRILAREIARRIYTKHFTTTTKEFQAVRDVFAKISTLTKAELNNEPFSQELLGCVKVHLWRRLYYNTLLPIKEGTINASLEKA